MPSRDLQHDGTRGFVRDEESRGKGICVDVGDRIDLVSRASLHRKRRWGRHHTAL